VAVTLQEKKIGKKSTFMIFNTDDTSEQGGIWALEVLTCRNSASSSSGGPWWVTAQSSQLTKTTLVHVLILKLEESGEQLISKREVAFAAPKGTRVWSCQTKGDVTALFCGWSLENYFCVFLKLADKAEDVVAWHWVKLIGYRREWAAFGPLTHSRAFIRMKKTKMSVSVFSLEGKKSMTIREKSQFSKVNMSPPGKIFVAMLYSQKDPTILLLMNENGDSLRRVVKHWTLYAQHQLAFAPNTWRCAASAYQCQLFSSSALVNLELDLYKPSELNKTACSNWDQLLFNYRWLRNWAWPRRVEKWYFCTLHLTEDDLTYCYINTKNLTVELVQHTWK